MQGTRLIYENRLYFYTPALHSQKLKLKNNAMDNVQNYQNLSKFDKRCERPV